MHKKSKKASPVSKTRVKLGFQLLFLQFHHSRMKKVTSKTKQTKQHSKMIQLTQNNQLMRDQQEDWRYLFAQGSLFQTSHTHPSAK